MIENNVYWVVTCTNGCGGFSQVVSARDSYEARAKIVAHYRDSPDLVEVRLVERYRGIVVKQPAPLL